MRRACLKWINSLHWFSHRPGFFSDCFSALPRYYTQQLNFLYTSRYFLPSSRAARVFRRFFFSTGIYSTGSAFRGESIGESRDNHRSLTIFNAYRSKNRNARENTNLSIQRFSSLLPDFSFFQLSSLQQNVPPNDFTIPHGNDGRIVNIERFIKKNPVKR